VKVADLLALNMQQRVAPTSFATNTSNKIGL